MSTKYGITKSKEKKLPMAINYVLESFFPFTPHIFIKIYIWSINFEELSISSIYSEISLAF